METQSDFPKSQVYKRNIFKNSIVQMVGWDPSLNLGSEKGNFQKVLSALLVFVFFRHLPLTVTSMTFPVIFEMNIDWLTRENPSVQYPVTLALI